MITNQNDITVNKKIIIITKFNCTINIILYCKW